MKTATRFNLPDGFDRTQIDDLLTEYSTFLVEPPLAQSWNIYDTFDWRLFNQALTLQWSEEGLVLRSLSDNETLHQLPAAALPDASPPRFVRDLPAGVFREQLSAIIKDRALLELATSHTWSSTYRILNRDEKTVARLVYIAAHPDVASEGPPLAAYLSLQPLRGYARQAQQLTAYLQQSLDIASEHENVYSNILQAAGQTPGAYSGKLNIQLEPDMPATAAAMLIQRQSLATIRANEAGIKADIDIEFLHDYRIAVRRTRSALSQIRQVFPPAITNKFKREFKTLGTLTNNLRDLDVYLLSEADFRAMLPPAMQEDISPLFDYLRSHRADALAEVITGLESAAYACTLEEWEAFLHEAVMDDSAANASIPIIKLARKHINRQYQRIVRDGNYILEHTEDELLHALRLECKKLRYLLEFFASLFPQKEISSLIKKLKDLQDNLGEFTDLAVQQGYLLSIAEALDIEEAQARRALVATGFLVETMARRQQAVRADFAGSFTKFASAAHQRQFNKLFAKGQRGKS